MSGRGRLLGVGVVTLLVITSGAIVWRKVIEPRRAAEQQCRAVRANAAAAPRHVTAGPVTAYLLGDSYVTGWGLPNPSRSFAVDLARDEHWSATLDGWAGSGFTNPGPCGGHTYAARVGSIPPGTDIAVIEGGLNDTRGRGVTAAAMRVLDMAKQRARTVYLIGPARVPAVDSGAVNRDLAAAARRAGVTYVPLRVRFPTGPDREHPTTTGAAELARYVAARITPVR